MFEKNAILFLYSVSPVHVGAGTATGVIDNPIQREVHTGHPTFAGSGLKGAIRHSFASLGGDGERADRLFGPREQGDLHAGAVSFGDGQLVALPVRSRRAGFVYATSPIALSRLQRLLTTAGHQPEWSVPELPDGDTARAPALTTESGLAGLAGDGGHLDLEVFEFIASADARVATIAQWLADHALTSDQSAYFRRKLARDLVILDDTDLDHFSRNAMVVEPHVRINEETGTADRTGLFYTENLPPETLMAAPVMASAERSGEREMDAEAVMAQMRTALGETTLQVGGDATTGRGLVNACLLEGEQ